MLKKMRAALEKCIDFLIKKSSKIDDKSSPKVRKTLLARKIDKKSLPGAPFGAKDRFLVDFGDPQGTQKSSQRGEHHWGKGSWELSGSHFGRFSAFFSILRPFLVNSGFLLGHPGSNLINSNHFFVVCVCVCVCVSFVWGDTVYFFGLLGCCVVGFLDS